MTPTPGKPTTLRAAEDGDSNILHSLAHSMLPSGKIVPLLLDDNGVVFGLADLHRKVDELTAKVDELANRLGGGT